MQVQIVAPSHQQGEGRWLLLTAVLILLVVGGFIGLRQRTELDPTSVSEAQVSAYASLGVEEQGTFSDLRLAALEIQSWRELEGNWPTVADLQELLIAPFVDDVVGSQRGNLQWQMSIESEGQLGFYWGISEDSKVSGSFALQIEIGDDPSSTQGHFHVWYRQENTNMPELMSKNALQKAGFREVIAYEGAQERKRLQGEP